MLHLRTTHVTNLPQALAPIADPNTLLLCDKVKAILAHNRDEEKEHAAMILEWSRRKDQIFEKELKDFLFTDKTIAHD